MLELLMILMPLVSSGIILAFGKYSEKFTKILAFLVLIFCLISSFSLVGEERRITYPWIPSLRLNLSILLDKWSSTFNFVVSLIGTLILLYSFAYIENGNVRYYSLFLLFVGSMMGFVSAGNFIQLFIFWELMGVCSYLLIGFWYRRKKAVKAGLKAILTTKIGDVCLFLAILLFFYSTNSFDLTSLDSLTRFRQTISVLFVLAILTKSAQFPFYFWLADAMEGPSTVSALLHSATMVASGAFLLLRILPIMTTESLVLLLFFSSITVLLGGFLALTNYDIKRILAFSTISQLAFMIIAIASLSEVAGFIHMINHAFFKSLLFLCAGTLIHYCGTRDLRRMKVSRKYVPILFFAFLIGILSLIGVPPLNGFWSKELILESSLQTSVITSFIVSLGTLLTILYSSRLFSKVFSKGKFEEKFGFMEFSMLSLAIICVVTGLMEIPLVEFQFQPILISSFLLGLGFFLSYIYYFKGIYSIPWKGLHELLRNEFYLEKFFSKLAKASENLARFEVFDRRVSDGVFRLSKSLYKLLELDLEKIEVENLNRFFRSLYSSLKKLQTSYLNYNILAMVMGITIMLILIILGV